MAEPLIQVVLPADVVFAWSSSQSLRTCASRRALLQSSTYPILTRVFAAVTIQRFYRGHRTRTVLLETDAMFRPQRFTFATPFSPYHLASPASHYASSVISKFIRRVIQHSVPVQGVAGGTLPANAHARAAVVIVRTWRSYCDRSIYRLLRDCVRVHEVVSPIRLLKRLRAPEYHAADAATQFRVRLRLGGAVWPPAVYYRVSTSGSVCDVGAFAPRDYVRERYAPQSAVVVTNGGAGRAPQVQVLPDVRHDAGRAIVQAASIAAVADDSKRRTNRSGGGRSNQQAERCGGVAVDTTGWYRRTGEAPWIVVPMSVLGLPASLGATSVAHVPATIRDDPSKKRIFAPTKTQRVAEAVSAVKKRRRQWMVELYAGRRERVGGDEEVVGSSAVDVVDAESRSARAAEMAAVLERLSDEEVEAEVSALVGWVDGLDSGTYSAEWHDLGTTPDMA